MPNGIVPFTSYFPQESLLDAKLKGEQLQNMQAQRGLAEREFQAQQAQNQEMMKIKRLQGAGELLDNLHKQWGIAKDKEGFVNYIRNRGDIAEAVSPLVDLSTWNPTEGAQEFVYAGPEGPATIDGQQGTLKFGVKYRLNTDGTYETIPMTIEDKKKVVDVEKTQREGGSDATALMKNAKYISKTLKIPESEAISIAMQSKTMPREQFIMQMAQRALGSFGDPKEAVKKAEEIYDDLFPKESTMPAEPEQDILEVILEEEGI